MHRDSHHGHLKHSRLARPRVITPKENKRLTRRGAHHPPQIRIAKKQFRQRRRIYKHKRNLSQSVRFRQLWAALRTATHGYRSEPQNGDLIKKAWREAWDYHHVETCPNRYPAEVYPNQINFKASELHIWATHVPRKGAGRGRWGREQSWKCMEMHGNAWK